MIGASGVGKTSVLSQFAHCSFNDNEASTIGVEYLTHNISVNGQMVRLQLWDTAGQERYHSVVSQFFRGAAGAVLIFDITSQASFEEVETWRGELARHGPANMQVLLVGNKLDLEPLRAVSVEAAQNLAQKHAMCFL